MDSMRHDVFSWSIGGLPRTFLNTIHRRREPRVLCFHNEIELNDMPIWGQWFHSKTFELNLQLMYGQVVAEIWYILKYIFEYMNYPGASNTLWGSVLPQNPLQNPLAENHLEHKGKGGLRAPQKNCMPPKRESRAAEPLASGKGFMKFLGFTWVNNTHFSKAGS